jgi:peptidoglycan-N-acetylglucosamine deacetylase
MISLRLFASWVVICLLIIAPTSNGQADNRNPQTIGRRSVAITFDDLPAAGRSRNYDADVIKEMTRRLLTTFASHKIRVVGFVNEKGLYQKTGEVDERIAVLQMWLDAGQELGNHTFSHVSFNTTPIAVYEEDVIRGETVVKMLLEKKGMKLRFFRYPFFFTGPTLETKKAFEAFLAQRGYTNAPATIDNQDYLFADVYAKAKEKGDKVTMKRVADAYVLYMEKMMEFYEKLSVDLFGREIPQVFYIHANPLNADHFEDLAQMLERRDYRFVSLEQVLRDKAYSHPDNYAGTNGISWLQRWAITEGKGFRTEPDVPEFVKKMFEAK